MPDLECRVANLEARVSRAEERQSVTEEKVNSMAEVLTERRRTSDKMMDLLQSIQKDVHRMQGFTNGVKWLIGIMVGTIGTMAVFVLEKISNG